MSKTFGTLKPASGVHYHVQALGWVGGCFREEKKAFFRIILTSHKVDMQTEQGDSWQKQPSLRQTPTSVKHRLVCSVKVMHPFILAGKHLHIHPAVELPKRQTKQSFLMTKWHLCTKLLCFSPKIIFVDSEQSHHIFPFSLSLF